MAQPELDSAIRERLVNFGPVDQGMKIFSLPDVPLEIEAVERKSDALIKAGPKNERSDVP